MSDPVERHNRNNGHHRLGHDESYGDDFANPDAYIPNRVTISPGMGHSAGWRLSNQSCRSVWRQPLALVLGGPSRMGGGNDLSRTRRQIVVLLRPVSRITSVSLRILMFVSVSDVRRSLGVGLLAPRRGVHRVLGVCLI